jgi:hypothetical protein
MIPSNADRRPGQGAELAGSGGSSSPYAHVNHGADIPPACPLIRAALRDGGYRVMLAVITYHPARLCPARRDRAA